MVRTRLDPAQVDRRVRGDLHTVFLVQFPAQGFQLGLARVEVSAGQVPDVGVRVTVRPAVDEAYLSCPDQHRDDHRVHGWQ